MLRALPRAAVRHPRLALSLMATFVLAAAPGLLWLEPRTDGHALVPQADPAVRRDAEIRGHFQLRDPIVVFVRAGHRYGIYNVETLASVQIGRASCRERVYVLV